MPYAFNNNFSNCFVTYILIDAIDNNTIHMTAYAATQLLLYYQYK